MQKSLVPLFVVLIIASGCGKREEGLAESAGNKVGETLTEFAQGVGKGIDKQMLVNAELSEELKKQGVSRTIAKAIGIDHPSAKGITIYFMSKAPVNMKLIAKALDKQGLEIGRSIVDVEFAADDAKYVTFQFDEEMDMQSVDKYCIDLRK